MEDMVMSYLSRYKGKKVLVTGFTGFKGTWLCKILLELGAEVTGYALEPLTSPNIYGLSEIEKDIDGVIGDVRDFESLYAVVKKNNPDYIFHLAAQPIVLTGYQYPRETFETNIMGTVNLLESIRKNDCKCSVVNVTTDKVYENMEHIWGYREHDTLNGRDPYSNSKSCSELVTESYKKSFFNNKDIVISTVRAGNVIGGGDFADNRIIPDCVRAALAHTPINVRNPLSIRPYQHVLEPLMAYLLIGQKQEEDCSLSGAYNIGPDEKSCVTTEALVSMFCDCWGDNQTWSVSDAQACYKEANYLKLDCSKVKDRIGWMPRWDAQEAVRKTVEWTKRWQEGMKVADIMKNQISEYMN